MAIVKGFESDSLDPNGTAVSFFADDDNERGNVLVKMTTLDGFGRKGSRIHVMEKNEAIALMAWLSEVTR